MVNLRSLIDDAMCSETIRGTRRPDGVRRPGCGFDEVIRTAATIPDPRRNATDAAAVASGSAT